MSKPEKLQPVASVGERARKAAVSIRNAFYDHDLDRGFGQTPPQLVLTDAQIAALISREFEAQDGRMRELLKRAIDYIRMSNDSDEETPRGNKIVADYERLLRGE